MTLTLVIGDRNYSSWSLRGWLMARQSGAPFETVLIPLGEADTTARIRRYSPSGRVPCLVDGEVTVWESIAIGEYLAERFPDAGLWPEDRSARAAARAVSAEMHAGFMALRRTRPMHIRGRRPGLALTAEAAADVARIAAIWRDCRARFGASGPFLFGGFTIADAMFAPVVMRFRTYAIAPGPVEAAYMQAVLAHPAVIEWGAAAEAEPWTKPRYEAIPDS
jgi:glutathione S-transferase